jgi:hypothetical protein
MGVALAPPANLVREAVIEVAQLPDQDLLQVMQFVRELKQRQTIAARRPSVAEIRAKAKRLAAEIGDMSRAEVMAQFHATTERIRHQAIADGTAIEEDWQSN